MVAAYQVQLLGWETELKTMEYQRPPVGNPNHPMKGRFVDATFEFGKAKGGCCKSATKEQVLDCLRSYIREKASQVYQFPFLQCRARAKDALDACCLKLGEKMGSVPRGSIRAEYDPVPLP